MITVDDILKILESYECSTWQDEDGRGAKLSDVLWQNKAKYELWNLANFIKENLDAQIPNWNPIETAPKDGTFVIGCEKDRTVRQVSFEKNTGFWVYLWKDSDGDNRSDVFSPTHWMPLPKSPKDKDEIDETHWVETHGTPDGGGS